MNIYFQVRGKLALPCSIWCCGNKFGRVGRHKHGGKTNRKKLMRRYARRVLKQIPFQGEE